MKYVGETKRMLKFLFGRERTIVTFFLFVIIPNQYMSIKQEARIGSINITK